MSQRLMQVSETQEREPLWRNEDGVPFYLPMGAAPDDDDAEDGADGGDEGDDGDASGDAGSDSEDDKDEKVSKAELDRVRARMVAADKRAADAEKKIREAEDKDKSALELAQREAQEAKDDAEKNRSALKDLRIQNAFLMANDITWHNPERALALADLSEVTIDEDGNVDKKALKKALKALSESDSYLVKKTTDGEGGDSGGAPSGEGVGSGKKGKGGKYDKTTLERSFPALASRG